jgi:peptidoglycan hydrolase CwlO-like protein
MKALNYKEKSDAIIKFCLLFLTIIIIVGLSLFFSFSFKNDLSEKKQKQLELFRTFKTNEKVLLIKIDSLDAQISNFGQSGVLKEIETIDITKKINFEDYTKDDSTAIKIGFKLSELFKKYLNLKVATLDLKKQISELEGNSGQVDEKIKELKEDLEKVEDELKECKSKSED